jgi:exodeoxyribonuclease VII large subunit
LEIISVSALNRAVAASLERSFPLMRVRGEIAQFTRAASGHWYFSLRDEAASVRSVMFKGRSSLLGWVPKEGDQVEVSAVVTLYEPRGDFQLRVESMTKAGQGALFEAFLARRERLAKEGLLAPERKRPLPDSIHTVGLVTSLAAAALRDVVVTLTELAPRVCIRLYPSAVQGEEAPRTLLQSLKAADADPLVEVVLLVRGGGSLEDLWAFNDEALARAIGQASKVVVVGVGHETDVTLADLVADVRAATPTAAAQCVAERDQAAWQTLLTLRHRQNQLMQRQWSLAQQRLDLAAQSLRSPRETWQARRHRMETLGARLSSLVVRQAQAQRLKFSALEAALGALDPTAILRRGYAIALDANGQLVTDASQVRVQAALKIQLAKGLLNVRVESPPADPAAG